LVGSARAEVVWRCGATVSFELAGVRAGGDDVLGFLGRERARQEGENETGLLLVLRHARVGELRLCSELSTATARWRPRSSSGWRGEGRRGPAREEVGPEGCRSAAGGRWAKQEVAGGVPWRRAVPLSAGGGEAERERGGRRLLGLFANSKKFRDPTVKLK